MCICFRSGERKKKNHRNIFKTWLMLCISTDPDKLNPIRFDPIQKLKLRATAYNINTLRVDESNTDEIYSDRYVKS